MADISIMLASFLFKLKKKFTSLCISQCSLTSKAEKILHAIMIFVILHYFPMWFNIKADSAIMLAPSYSQKEAWQAHSKFVPFALLNRCNEDHHFKIFKILENRKDKNLGSASVRPFVTPPLNWDTTFIRNMHVCMIGRILVNLLSLAL